MSKYHQYQNFIWYIPILLFTEKKDNRKIYFWTVYMPCLKTETFATFMLYANLKKADPRLFFINDLISYQNYFMTAVVLEPTTTTARKIRFSMKDFPSKWEQIHRKLWIWSHLLKTSLMENFIFCVVHLFCKQTLNHLAKHGRFR